MAVLSVTLLLQVLCPVTSISAIMKADPVRNLANVIALAVTVLENAPLLATVSFPCWIAVPAVKFVKDVLVIEKSLETAPTTAVKLFLPMYTLDPWVKLV